MSLLSIKALRADEDWGTDSLRGKMWVAAKACYHLKMASMQWMASTWVPSFPVSYARSWLYLPNQQTLLGAFVRCFVGDCPFVASSGHKNSVSTVELSATLGRADFFASSIQGPGQPKVGPPGASRVVLPSIHSLKLGSCSLTLLTNWKISWFDSYLSPAGVSSGVFLMTLVENIWRFPVFQTILGLTVFQLCCLPLPLQTKLSKKEFILRLYAKSAEDLSIWSSCLSGLCGWDSTSTTLVVYQQHRCIFFGRADLIINIISKEVTIL